MRLHRLSFGGERHSNTFHNETMFPGGTGEALLKQKLQNYKLALAVQRDREGTGEEQDNPPGKEAAQGGLGTSWGSLQSPEGSAQHSVPVPKGMRAGKGTCPWLHDPGLYPCLAQGVSLPCPGCIPAQCMGSGAAGLAVSTHLSREKEKHVWAWREAESLPVLWTEPGLEDLAEENTYWCL